MRFLPSVVHRTLAPAALCAALACSVTAAMAGPNATGTAVAAGEPAVAEAAATSADPVQGLLADKPPVGAPTTGESAFVGRMRDKASDMVVTAMNFLGVPYRRGGETAEQGFDCSGFTRKVFATSLGLVLPHRADEQAKAKGLVAIARSELQPGDLVFFNTLRHTFSHVGIYIGDGKFIHAPRAGGEVRIEDLNFMYWAKRYTGARRVDDGPLPAGAPEAAPVATLVSLPTLR